MTLSPEQIQYEAKLHLLRGLKSLSESLNLNTGGWGYTDPRDYGIGDHPGFAPASLGNNGLQFLDKRKRGEDIPVFLNEYQLSWLRRSIRALCAKSEIALAVIGVHTRYAIGKGLTYKAVAVNESLTPAQTQLVNDVQAVIDAFVEFNNLGARETETLIRQLIDGEAILRLFPTNDDMLAIRFVEPEHILSPTGSDDPANSFGIRTQRYDVESVEGYWIVQGLPDEHPQPDLIDASEVVHFKWHETPSTSKRGLTPFYPIETNLRLAEDLLISTVSLAKARAKIAMLRKLTGAISDVAQTLVQNQAAATYTDPVTSQVTNVERLPYGSILTVPSEAEVEFPGLNLAASDHVAVYQMVLRTIGARFCMPEYLISGDASNANYASTMVSESPFVRSMEGLQDAQAKQWGVNRLGTSSQSVIWRQLMHLVRRGYFPSNLPQLVKIQVEGPSLNIRDNQKEAMVDEIYNRIGAKSITTIQLEQGLEPDQERKNFAVEKPPTTAPTLLPPGVQPPTPNAHPQPGNPANATQVPTAPVSGAR